MGTGIRGLAPVLIRAAFAGVTAVVLGASIGDVEVAAQRVGEPPVSAAATGDTVRDLSGRLLYLPNGRGWMGFSYEMKTPPENDLTPIEIARVMESGPASRAGLRVGDILLSVDGSTEVRARLAELRDQIEPGDEVRLEVLRDGRRRTISFAAAPWDPTTVATVVRATPTAAAPASSDFVAIAEVTDSMIRAIKENPRRYAIESSEISVESLVVRGFDTIHSGASFSTRLPSGMPTVWTTEVRTETADSTPSKYLTFVHTPTRIVRDSLPSGSLGRAYLLPFEGGDNFFTSRPAFPHTELEAQRARLELELREITREEETRIVQLIRSLPPGSPAFISDDAELRRIRQRADSIRVSLHRLQEEVAGGRGTFLLREGSTEELDVRAGYVARGGTARLATLHYVAAPRGVTFFFGARITDVAGLAEDERPPGVPSRGVYVMRVPEGSVADRASLRAGDVIVEAAGEEVGTVRDLVQRVGSIDRRQALLSVIRSGERVVIRLPGEGS